MRPWHRERLIVLATLGLAAGCVVATWTLRRALADAPHDDAVRAENAITVRAIDESVAPPTTLIARTVDHDLFHPERRRPRTPFRLPAEEESARRAAVPTAPTSVLRLLGTVVTPGHDAFVMGQLGNDAPRVVRVGGTLGGFTLHRIEPGRAIFTAPSGETMDLRVSKAGP